MRMRAFEIIAVCRDREVDRRALDPLGVAQAAPRADSLAAKCLDDLPRSVGAAAVDDDDPPCRGDRRGARNCTSSAPMWLGLVQARDRPPCSARPTPVRQCSRFCVGIMRQPPAMGSGGRRPPDPAGARPARGNRRDRRPRCRDPAPRSSAAWPRTASAVRPPSSAANASGRGIVEQQAEMPVGEEASGLGLPHGDRNRAEAAAFIEPVGQQPVGIQPFLEEIDRPAEMHFAVDRGEILRVAVGAGKADMRLGRYEAGRNRRIRNRPDGRAARPRSGRPSGA